MVTQEEGKEMKRKRRKNGEEKKEGRKAREKG